MAQVPVSKSGKSYAKSPARPRNISGDERAKASKDKSPQPDSGVKRGSRQKKDNNSGAKSVRGKAKTSTQSGQGKDRTERPRRESRERTREWDQNRNNRPRARGPRDTSRGDQEKEKEIQENFPNEEANRHKFHPLEHPWTFWFDRRMRRGKTGPGSSSLTPVALDDYQSNLKQVGSFRTVEGFWRLYHHMIGATQLDLNSNYHLFKKGIKPMWEDPANYKGGKWTIRIPTREKHNLNYYWRNVVLALIGETLDEEDECVCGAVLSRRRGGDRISIWTKKHDRPKILRLGTRLQELVVQDVTAGESDKSSTTAGSQKGSTNPHGLEFNYEYHEDSINHANAGPVQPGTTPGVSSSSSSAQSTGQSVSASSTSSGASSTSSRSYPKRPPTQ